MHVLNGVHAWPILLKPAHEQLAPEKKVACGKKKSFVLKYDACAGGLRGIPVSDAGRPGR